MFRHCPVLGCTNPIARRAGGTEHEACGVFHHNILMSERAGDALVCGDGWKDIRTCPVAGCNKKRFTGKDCCSKTHALLFMRQVFQKFSGRKCKLPGCYKHVLVEIKEDGSRNIHGFCGWSHCKTFHLGCNQAVYQEVREEYLVEALKTWVFHNDQGSMKVDEDFFSKHPWEVLPAGVKAICMIVKCKFKDKACNKREMITKEGFHWKQQGIKHTKSNTVEELTIGDNKLTKRHLTYIKLGSKKGSGNEDKENPMYTMIEYRLQKANGDIDLKMKKWCMVKIAQHRGNLGQGQGNRKRQKIDGRVSSSELDNSVGMGKRIEAIGDSDEQVTFEGAPSECEEFEEEDGGEGYDDNLRCLLRSFRTC